MGKTKNLIFYSLKDGEKEETQSFRKEKIMIQSIQKFWILKIGHTMNNEYTLIGIQGFPPPLVERT